MVVVEYQCLCPIMEKIEYVFAQMRYCILESLESGACGTERGTFVEPGASHRAEAGDSVNQRVSRRYQMQRHLNDTLLCIDMRETGAAEDRPANW